MELTALPPTIWHDRPVSGGDLPPWREISELLCDPVLRDPKKILDNSGNINSPHRPLITQQALLVVAFRDSFMHGETPSTLEKPIWRYRKQWLNSDAYNLETIAQACIGVWKDLLLIVKKASSPASPPSL